MVPKTNLLPTLKELEDFIEKGDEYKLKESIDLFYNDLDSKGQCAAQTALIRAACRSNQADILYYLLYETKILDHFPEVDLDQNVRTRRTEAFKFAISCDALPMVDMLYDYWSGNLHWDGNHIKKITTLGKMLEEARVKCPVNNLQMLIDINCLIKFNAFQQELYSSITNIEQEKPADMLVEVFRIYDKYSDIDQVRIPHEDKEDERKQKTDLEDKTSDYFRMHFYFTYNIYFRKLDFNVALLILDNWFILRRQFRDRFNQPKEYFKNNPTVKSSYEKAVSLYKDIECTLYHFIYRTWGDWTLYLPRNRQITVEEHHTGIHEGGIIKNLKIKHDEHVLNNGPVLFLERKSFSDRVKELKSLLEAHIISANPAEIWVQNYEMKKPEDICILLDDNYLTPITLTDINTPINTYMRDFYSISKIVYYINAIENTNDVLMIERVLQVTGEMSKSTRTSNHLSDSAKSLLQIAVSVDTVKHLSNIREFLSHADKGQLNTRDDKKYGALFHDIRQDLIMIKQMITPVLNIYKKKLNKSLLEKGLALLDERIQNLPSSKVSQHIGACNINLLDFFNSEKYKPLIRQLSVDTGIKIELLNEIIWISFNRDDLLHKINLTKKDIYMEIKGLLPMYIQNIKNVLAAIDDNNEKVNLINHELERCNIKETLPDNPNKKAITTIKSTVEIMKRNKNTDVDYDAILLTLKDIKDFSGLWETITEMSFCYNESGDELCEKDKEGKLEIKNNLPSITKILKELGGKSDKNVVGTHTFDAIEKLDDFFKKHNSSKIGADKLKSLLIKRLKDLKEILQYDQHLPLKENLHKYKNDQKFRFQLEMVLADIANIYAEFTKDKTVKVMNKSNMLLREINLRNVLHHGNPFLDVIADVFNPYDLSMGLLSKAEMFAEHGDSMIQNLP